jgi:hypothetical protein
MSLWLADSIRERNVTGGISSFYIFFRVCMYLVPTRQTCPFGCDGPDVGTDDMKITHKLALAIATIAGVSAPAFGQATSSVTTNGTTQIIQPVTISQSSALAFGTIVRPTSGTSTISIGTGADTVSATGNALVLRGTTSRARYTVSGEGGETVTVSMPATFNLSKSGSPDLAVTLTRNPAGNLTLSNALGATGTAALDIGGSFSISSTTATGDYAGSFTVSVAYN